MSGPSVSLVGSFRKHYPDVVRAAVTFSGAGITVKSPTISTVIDPEADFVRFESDSTMASDHEIQAATLQKILSSDFVYVVNPGGYVGRTTAYEIGRIHDHGLAVYFLERPQDFPVDIPEGTILSPQDLVNAIGKTPGLAAPARRPRVAALPTADVAILTVRDHRLHALLVKRDNEPYLRKLALPGGFLRPGEALEQTARRELAEETGLDDPGVPLEQLRTYSAPGRDPRGRIITTAFLAIAPNLPEPRAGTDAYRADWVEVDDSLEGQLAFDHWTILRHARERARSLLEYTTVAAAFCNQTFTIGELRGVYEAVWGMSLDSRNFARKVHATTGFVVKTDLKRPKQRGRPAELYRRGSARLLYPPMLRFPNPKTAPGESVIP